MFEYESLLHYPSAFRNLTGMNPDDCERLFTDFVSTAQCRRQRSRTSKDGQPRQLDARDTDLERIKAKLKRCRAALFRAAVEG